MTDNKDFVTVQKEALKPCPFCGSTDIGNVSSHHPGPAYALHANDTIFAVNCKECGAGVPNRYRNDLVVDAWNRRAMLQAAPAAPASDADARPSAAPNPWKEAVLDVLAHNCIDAPLDESPRSILARVIAAEVQIALDPAVSADAQALIDRGRALAHGVQALDPNKVQLCRVDPPAYDNGQPCNCPEGTCRLWKGGFRPAGVKTGGGQHD